MSFLLKRFVLMILILLLYENGFYSFSQWLAYVHIFTLKYLREPKWASSSEPGHAWVPKLFMPKKQPIKKDWRRCRMNELWNFFSLIGPTHKIQTFEGLCTWFKLLWKTTKSHSLIKLSNKLQRIPISRIFHGYFCLQAVLPTSNCNFQRFDLHDMNSLKFD